MPRERGGWRRNASWDAFGTHTLRERPFASQREGVSRERDRQLGWLPIAGRSGPESYILPVIALSLGPAAVLARIVRVEMLTVLETDFVRTARAKRLPAWRIYLSHALPNAVTATLTLAGLLLSALVVGTVLVENVFAWPGLGSTIVGSIQLKDYPMAQATILVYGAGVLIINTIVDAVLAVLDPRTTVAED